MFDSVRVRLTLWYAGVLGLVLVVLALATYFVLQRNAMKRTDAALSDLGNAFLSTVRAELRDPADRASIGDAFKAGMAEHSFSDSSFCVFDDEGHLVAGPDPASGECRSGESAIEKIIVSGGSDSDARGNFRTVMVDKHGARLCVRHFDAAGKSYVLVVMQSLRRQEEFLEVLGETFAIVIPLAILLAGAGGYFLAWRSLQPIVQMSTQAGLIGAANLHERLQVRNSQDELGHLAKSFNDLLDRLDQSFARQRQFVADASHELRTPVAILCGEAEVALSQPQRSPEDYRESLGVLANEANRLRSIIEDLFTLARADAGQCALSPMEFYLDELIEDCCRNLRALALAKQLELRIEGDKEVQIQADEALVRRMILNLLDNAIKYSRPNSVVSVSCRRDDSAVLVSVSDSGAGIPEEFRTRIFERFFRVDDARSRANGDQGGAGLGLAISRWIAESHGGSLELVRSDSSGSTFKAILPLRLDPSLAPAN